MAPTVKFASNEPFTNHAKMILRSAAREVWSETVQMERAEPGEGVIGFGVDSGIRSLAPSQITTFPGAKSALVAAFFALESDLPLTPWPDADPDTILYLDIESHSVEDRWDMTPREFFRLGQYAWGPTGEVHLTTDYDEILSVIRRAHGVIAHNGHSFDLSVLFGKDSIEPLLMAKDRRIFDTMVFAGLAFPAPDKFTTSSGHTFYDGAKPEKALKWLGLDNLCYQFGTQGKIGDLKALAKKYGGFGSIPTDDPEFTRYAVQDVVALQELTTLLLRIHTPSEYDWREQLNAAIDAQNSRNGFCVDETKARARVEELRLRKEVILARLEEDYGFPTTGKSPWATKAGKESILKALADYAIVPEEIENWTRTATGNISLGGQTLIDFTLGTPAEEFGQALAELKGQRSLAQLALDSMQSDGKVHPDITALQRSGRKSTTKPGLTIWGSRDGREVEKAYFVASPGRKLVAFDYSGADARMVAAYSGDVEFAKRFAPGADTHDITGVIFFGEERYFAQRDELRPISKAGGHSLAYRIGSKKLAASVGVSQAEAQGFIDAYQEAYPDVLAWQNKVTNEGDRGQVINDWGRIMQVATDRSFTQSSALYGQSGTREIMVDALIKMLYRDVRLITWVVAQVHDELIFDIPEEELDWAMRAVVECMETTWGPATGGMPVEFTVSQGHPADDWRQATH